MVYNPNIMNPYQKVEIKLKQRLPGWWDGIIKLIPELEDLAQTPQPPQSGGWG